jgi:hypothetical protein
MSTADRRKQLKARKARLQAKKHAQLQERGQSAEEQVRADIIEKLRDFVTSGRARIAVATIVEFRTVLAAMWEHDGVQVRTYSAKDEASLSALATAAERHISFEEWGDFLSHHLEAVADTENNQCAISIVEWKPGEGPNAQNLPMQG